MKPISTLALSLLALPSVAWSQSVPPSLPPDHYLVGTQGWVNSAISNTLNTIQVISPYTRRATDLRVTGLPTAEAPASFHIESSTSFLVGTKSLNTKVATGNLYRVQFNKKTTAWVASRLNTVALPINASDLVVSGQTAYIIGSSTFNRTGKDAQILTVSLRTGAVAVHLQLGDRFKVLNPGAFGLGSSLVLVGNNLHAFTFDTTNTTPTWNEHWQVSLSNPVTARKIGGSLPVSKRRLTGTPPKGHGFGTSGVFVDPKNNKNFVVVGRWGELVWRNINSGKTVRYEAFPGTVNLATTGPDELWRGVTLNTNTHAFGLGDHNGASIDERRCQNGPGATQPFSNNIAKAIQPKVTGKTVLFTIAGMTYIPGSTTSSYRTIGIGCPDRTNGIPCSYATGAPTRGNPVFGLSLHARPKNVSSTTTAILMIGAVNSKQGIPIVSGCRFWIQPNSLGIIAPVGSRSPDVSIGPFALPSTAVKVYTQWVLFAPRANAINLVLSDARALVL